jgi:hypothetical protein
MSWSGLRSGTFAEEFKPWLEQVLPGTDVWLSIDDIDKGDIWFTEIIDGLKGCQCGIVLVTRENHVAPWLHFEAGGMIKGLGKSHVAIIALDMDYDELKQPLSLFNALHLNRVGVWHLVKSFNKLSDRPIKDRVLEVAFEKFWPDLDKAYQMLFPDSYKKSQESEPVHIAPKPSEMVFGTRLPSRGKHQKSKEPAESNQPGLFNGEKK